jgi:hypothetical protein
MLLVLEQTKERRVQMTRTIWMRLQLYCRAYPLAHHLRKQCATQIFLSMLSSLLESVVMAIGQKAGFLQLWQGFKLASFRLASDVL